MKTKALLAALLLCGSAVTASAQNEGFRFGATVGMNVSSITNTSADSRIGFNIGVRGEYSFSNSLYANAALLFSQKGAKYGVEYAGYDTKLKANPGYIEIPLHFGYHYDLGNNVGIFLETGPYFAFGVCGKEKIEAGKLEYKSDFFGDDGANTFDAGWGLRGGVEASGFQVHLGYDHGFSKLYDGGNSKNSNFSIGVSYMF